MMENRSFDHLLGYLQHNDPAHPNLDRLKPSCPVDPSRPDGKRVATRASPSPVLGNDPDHSHQAVMLRIFGRPGTPGVGTPSMTGFLESYRHKVTAGTLKPLAWWLYRAKLRPGSAPDRVVADMVADFTREGPAPNPAAVEFGNGTR